MTMTRRALMWSLLWASDALAWCGLSGSWLWWRLIYGAARLEEYPELPSSESGDGPW